MTPCFPFPARILPQFPDFVHYSVLVYPLISHYLKEALAWVVNVAGACIMNMNRPPACPRFFYERGNKES